MLNILRFDAPQFPLFVHEMKLLEGEAYYFFSWHWDGTSTSRGEHYQERVIIKRLIQISLHSAICHKCVQFK